MRFLEVSHSSRARQRERTGLPTMASPDSEGSARHTITNKGISEGFPLTASLSCRPF